MNEVSPVLDDHRHCCVCERKLVGRRDKVFCDISCKNKYHSEFRKHTKSVSNETIKLLTKNYKILCYIKGENANKVRVKALELKRHGFNFDIVSGIESTKIGIRMNVYEFTWYYSKNQTVMIHWNDKESKMAPYVYRRWEIHYKNLQN